MSIKKADPSVFRNWVQSLIDRERVFGVQAKGERFAFGPLARPEDLRLDYDVTILPPKKYFQPQREVLLEFDRSDGFESVMNEESFIVLGVHPCDMEGIRQMDEVFQQNNVDAHYLAYRERATIVVSDVRAVSETVFSGCMGHATAEDMDVFDVLLTHLPDGSELVDVRTEKGEALLGGLEDSPDANAGDLAAREEVWRANRERLRKFELKMKPKELPALLERSAGHPVWEEMAALCYSCGSCNLVCPTCYCFTVDDEMNWDMQTGRRVRTWDGCMLAGFAKVAGGHDFRPNPAARYRHRYYRKGKYMWDMIGKIGCVGCGRCVAACTAKIANPVEVYNRLLEDK